MKADVQCSATRAAMWSRLGSWKPPRCSEPSLAEAQQLSPRLNTPGNGDTERARVGDRRSRPEARPEPEGGAPRGTRKRAGPWHPAAGATRKKLVTFKESGKWVQLYPEGASGRAARRSAHVPAGPPPTGCPLFWPDYVRRSRGSGRPSGSLQLTQPGRAESRRKPRACHSVGVLSTSTLGDACGQAGKAMSRPLQTRGHLSRRHIHGASSQRAPVTQRFTESSFKYSKPVR